MEQPTRDDIAPFSSLAELRSEHVALLRESRTVDKEKLAERVGNFVQRAQLTGARIENDNDRDSAQGVLDYWSAWRFSAGKREALSAAPPTLVEFVPLSAPQVRSDENPFVGMRAYEERDSGFFIGREEATRSLLDKVRTHPIVFVSGALGSGKSSLVFAGLVPRWRTRAVLETNKESTFPVVLPGADPLTALVKAVLAVATVKIADGSGWIAEQVENLRRTPASLPGIVAAVVPNTAIVLIVDQFEEVFTLCTDQLLRDRFTQAIAVFADDANSPNRVILIIRDDYERPSSALPALKRFADDAGAHFTPPALTAAELIRTISSAGDAVGLRFDEGIVEELAQDVAGDPSLLPTLQFALSRLWAALPKDSNRVTREVFAKVGKPRIALARAAEAAFENLTAGEQETARKVFLELVQSELEFVQPAEGAGPGRSAAADTPDQTTVGGLRRRRLSLDVIVQLTGENAARVEAVLRSFEGAELIRRRKDSDSSDERFEVTHEALANNWGRLRDWLKAGREDSRTKLQFMANAQMWRESGENRDYLLIGDAIKNAMPYRNASPDLRDLIAASEAHEQRKTKRQRIYLILTIVAVLVTSLFFIVVQRMEYEARLDLNQKRQDLNQNEITIQQIETEAIKAREADAFRLREAEEKITQQQKQIEQLQKKLKDSHIAIAPRPPEPARTSNTISEVPAAGQKGWIWVGSEAASNLRDSKQPSVAVSPTAVTPGSQYVITKNVVLRKEKPDSANYAMSPSLGLVLNPSTVTAQGPAIPYDRPSGTKQYWLEVMVEKSDKPIVYYQYPAASKASVQSVADAIQPKGYRIAELQLFEDAKGANEVRFFFADDKPAAERLVQAVKDALAERKIKLPSTTKAVDHSWKVSDKNYPGVLELWLDTGSQQ